MKQSRGTNVVDHMEIMHYCRGVHEDKIKGKERNAREIRISNEVRDASILRTTREICILILLHSCQRLSLGKAILKLNPGIHKNWENQN